MGHQANLTLSLVSGIFWLSEMDEVPSKPPGNDPRTTCQSEAKEDSPCQRHRPCHSTSTLIVSSFPISSNIFLTGTARVARVLGCRALLVWRNHHHVLLRPSRDVSLLVLTAVTLECFSQLTKFCTQLQLSSLFFFVLFLLANRRAQLPIWWLKS